MPDQSGQHYARVKIRWAALTGTAVMVALVASAAAIFMRHDHAGGATQHDAENLSSDPLRPAASAAGIAPSLAERHDLLLTGVVLGNRSLALVSVDGQPAQPYSVGDSIAKDIVLSGVSAFEAIVRHGQIVEKLPLHRVSVVASDTMPIAGVAPLIPAPVVPLTMRQAIHEQGKNWFVLDRSYVDAYLKSNDFLKQGRIVPESDGSFRIADLNPVGLFAQLGLNVGDVVRDVSVNGQSVNSVADMPGFLQQTGSAQQVQLQVLTNGQSRYLYYNLR
ncbi:MAG: type II secretion system protein N [Acidiferrobacterales bacterium]